MLFDYVIQMCKLVAVPSLPTFCGLKLKNSNVALHVGYGVIKRMGQYLEIGFWKV